MIGMLSKWWAATASQIIQDGTADQHILAVLQQLLSCAAILRCGLPHTHKALSRTPCL